MDKPIRITKRQKYKPKAERLCDEHYEQILKVASAMGQKHQYDQSELVSVGHTAFMSAVAAHKPQVGPFRPLLNTTLHNTMVTEMMRYNRLHAPTAQTEEGEETVMEQIQDNQALHPAHHMQWHEWMNELTEDARYIIHTIIDAPGEVIDILNLDKPKKARGQLKAHLRENKWSFDRIYRAFHELRRAVRVF